MRKFQIFIDHFLKSEFVLLLVLSFLVVLFELLFWLSLSIVLEVNNTFKFHEYINFDNSPLILIIVVVFRLVFSMLYAWFLHKISFQILARIRNSILQKTMKSDFSSFENLGKSVIANDITLNSAISVDTTLINGYKILNDSMLLLAIAVAFVLTFGLNVLWITLGLIIIVLTIALIIRPYIVNWSKIIVEANNEVFKNTDYSLFNLKEIKVNNLIKYVSEFSDKVFKKYSLIQTRIRFLQLAPKYLIESLFFLAVGILLYFNNEGNDIVNTLKITSLLILVGMRVMPLLNQLLISFNGYKSGAGAVDQLAKSFNKLKPQNNSFIKKSDSCLLKAENISFKYGSKQILKNFNISLSKGDMMLFSGPSGSGKTTALDILLGLRIPFKGNINYNFNSKIYYCSQHPFLPATSLKNYFLSNTSQSFKWDIFSKVLIDIGLEEFSDKPNYFLSESGSNLSGGQKQKIALSCALCSNADILILDEANSALDETSLKKSMKLISNYAKKSSVIMISHDTNIYNYFNKVIKFPL